jgi:hypothetical protein
MCFRAAPVKRMMSSIKVGPRKKYYALDALRQGRFDFDKGV